LVILDLTLPGIDGLEVIEKIREKSDIPIIISSARDDITDNIIGMERGMQMIICQRLMTQESL